MLVKIEIDGEYRRFSPNDYAALHARLVELFAEQLKTSGEGSSLQICYVDSEGDSIIISSNEEFEDAATSVAPNPLKLKVSVKKTENNHKAFSSNSSTARTIPIHFETPAAHNNGPAKEQQEKQCPRRQWRCNNNNNNSNHQFGQIPFGDHVLRFLHANPGLVENVIPTVQTVLENIGASIQATSNTNSATTNTTTPGASSTSKEESKTTVRHAAYCDVCKETIIGVRYKCGNCADYDLCEKCEKLPRNQTHDPSHVFLKVIVPLKFGPRTPLLSSNLYQRACHQRHSSRNRDHPVFFMDISTPSQQNEQDKMETENEEQNRNEEQNEKKTETNEQVDPRLEFAFQSLRQMGFTINEDELKSLLETYKYDISQILDQITNN